VSSGRGAAVGLEKKARTAGLPPRRIYLHSVCIFVTNLPTTDGDGLFETQEFDPASGAARAQGHTIVLGAAERGAFIPVVTRCRRVRKTVVLADGTTATIIVEICG
jgi:hypothetical protein